MTLVTLEEARARLPELIQLMAAGEKVVIADSEKWIAAIAAPPPMPPTPEEEAALIEKRKEVIRGWIRLAIANGSPPPAESKLWEIMVDEQVPQP